MLAYTVRRLGLALVTLWLATLLVFGALLLIPGNPAQAILGIEATPADLEALEARLGLDKPPLERYISWLGGILRGDLGQSIRYEQPISELIVARLGITLPIVVASLLLATILAVPIGILAARKAGSPIDLGVSVASLLGIVLPSFWVGLMFIYIFVVWLKLPLPTSFPIGGWENPERALAALVLPVLTVALASASFLVRLVRGSVLEVLSQEFIRTARAKGLAERVVLYKHALRNAALPVVTVLGLEFASLLIATVVVETVFGIPGLGSLSLTAISARDYPLVQGVVLVIAAFIVLMNLLVDLLYGLLDPRVSYA
ncbi:ABC transporter permease [Meiothermus taiwanensis]|jgi:peptide/nickel transport system permease protein|uniref:Dipeptide transport system permease protein DppB n=2 Tax=Meiothermus taiwanensis TaxID=172827 RepID=A0A399DQT9_9DEIN|nr:ABC transporter permease [Meiothermus taiwanensis]AWR85554.1 binding-protein-dependent transport systems inner membrane component [Meiothermus taiwanensis WR-220]KIQ54023.1 peptide ABC transporter [Meiothermus taiwanensis]KZK16389.1 peptide ABC transporter [Meiothermus taiwanensis]RIH74605.1 Dipeptide transport system permease protein DppB [Meiothermus taiwanensis]